MYQNMDFTLLKFELSEKHTKFAQSSSCFGNLLSKRPKYEEDFFKFCVFLRMSELYFAVKQCKIGYNNFR